MGTAQLTPGANRLLMLNVACAAAATALAAAELAGWNVTGQLEPWVIAVTDQLGGVGDPLERSPRRVLLFDPTPFAAWTALELLRQRRADAVISSDRTDELTSALASLERGSSHVGLRTLDLAAQMPPLTPVQLSILQRLGAGAPNKVIADREHLSLTSLKREMRSLRQILGAVDRPSLAQASHALGIHERVSPVRR